MMLNVAISLSVIVVVTVVGPPVATSLPVVVPGLPIETVYVSGPSTNMSSMAVNSMHKSSIGSPSLVNVNVVPSKASVPVPM